MTQRKENNYNQNYDNRNSQTERGYGVLPAPGILESYEELAPGAVAKIIEMARLEQEQRHIWENNYLRYMAYITKIGQLLGFMLAAIITFAALSLGSDGEYAMAIFISIVGYGYLIISAYISFSSRKILPRPINRKEEERTAHSSHRTANNHNRNRHRKFYHNRNRNSGPR